MLTHAAEFAEEFRVCKSSNFSSQISRESAKKQTSASKISAATRLSRLWNANAPANCIAAIVRSDGSLAVAPLEVLEALRTGWFGTFSRPSPPHPRADSFLRSNKPAWDFSSAHPPSPQDFFVLFKVP